jgi:subfamily B ATP-binding cassette protein MsbA
MYKIKKFIAKNFKDLAFYFGHLRYRIFLAVTISIGVGIMDGFGLTMFLPLLQMVSGAKTADAESLGNLKIIIEWIEALGINLTLVSVLAIMVAFFFLKGIAMFLNGAYRTLLRQLFIKKIRNNLLESLNGIKFKYFVISDVGRIQNTMTGEVERVSRSFQDYFRTVEQGILVLVYMGFAFFINAQFALLVSVGGIGTNIFYKQIYKRTKGKSREFTKHSHLYQGQIIQYITNFKYLKATALIHNFSNRIKISISNIENGRRTMGIYSAVLDASREPMLIFIVAIVIIIQVQVFKASLGPIILSLLFFYRALTSLLSLQNSWNRFLEVSGSLQNIRLFQNELNCNKDRNGSKLISVFTDKIELKNVYFSYDNRPVLSDIQISIGKNETVAFVGESGSGKTTLVNILAALMPVDKGEMKIDGNDVNTLDVTSYQKRIGYITQEPVIFNDSIYNNVTFWDEFSDKNLKRFKSALERASILDFVEKLPKAHNTMLGNNGVNLSGGQKQRISIARELYKNIDILIMDEATSALDTETESSIQESIEALKGQYTLLIVAHRLSTIKNVDRIILMKDGGIENIGSYSELVKNNKYFERMVKLQEV